MSGSQEFIQTSSVAYPDQGLTVSYSAPSGKMLKVFGVNAYNSSPTINSVGIFHSINNSQVKVFQLLAAGDTEKTTAIQAGSATAIFNTTNNDGVLFQSKEKFHMIAFRISQASTGSPVFTYKYWNGSSYATLTLLNTPVYSATGIQVVVFNAPIDWVAGDGSEDADPNLYSVQVIATTAPSQAVQIDSLKLGKMLKFVEEVPTKTYVSIDFDEEPYLLQAGEAIIPFFSYSNVSNRLEIAYKINP